LVSQILICINIQKLKISLWIKICVFVGEVNWKLHASFGKETFTYSICVFNYYIHGFMIASVYSVVRVPVFVSICEAFLVNVLFHVSFIYRLLALDCYCYNSTLNIWTSFKYRLSFVCSIIIYMGSWLLVYILLLECQSL
jgi:hypothetical protein